MRNLVICIGAIALLVACSSPQTAEEQEVLPAAEQISNLESLEKQMFTDKAQPDDSLANVIMDGYERFASQYPEHEMAPVFLDRSANVARGFRQYDRVLKDYKKIVSDYPDYEKIIETRFLIAFTYDNELKDKVEAEKHYKAIAEEYPNHLFGKEAKQRLATLHMSDEELIQHFKELNAPEKGN